MEGTETVTVMENLGTAITNGIEQCTTLLDKSLDLVVGNPLIMIFIASSLIGVGVGVFMKLKNAAN